MLQKLFAPAYQTAAPDIQYALKSQEVFLSGHMLTFYLNDKLQICLLKICSSSC